MIYELYMNRKRKMQTYDEALCRREANKLSMKQKQLCDTEDKTLHVNVVMCYAMLPLGFCTLVHSF